MEKFLHLKDRKPLTMGRSRLVFEHPEDAFLVVKVIRPDVIDARFGSGVAWYKRRRRYGRFLSYMREVQEFLAVHAAHGRSFPFLQTVVGFVETDLGLGLITEAALDRNGKLAPNLGTLIAEGRFDSVVRKDLEALLKQLLECNVIVSDMNVGNLVYAFSESHGDHFVLIDGLGNSNPFPFKAISQRLNRRSKRQRIEYLYDRIGKRLKNAGYEMPPLPENAR